VSVLVAESVVAGYDEAVILHGASVSIRRGEVVTIIGPNGAGKSTLLKAIVGLIPLREGRVALEGEDLAGRPPHAIVRAGVGYVPQVANVFPNLTVRENLEMGAFTLEDGVDDALERVYGLFPLCRERGGEKVGRLSGGQRQMVAIGRALMLAPRVLLLDEPSAGLAPTLQNEVFRHIRGIADAGTPVLLVEQNARKALAMSDRGLVLDMGRNRFEGRGPEVLANPDVAKLYLGGK